jgi:transposase-like protein
MSVAVVRYPRYLSRAAISCGVVLVRFAVGFCDIEDLLAQRGITVSYESIRRWCETFGARYARRLRRHAGYVATPGIWRNSS